jgi:two-component system CheB/CheR fusion protein
MNDAAHPPVEQAGLRAQGPVPRVMIADDNQDHVDMTALLLHTEGYDVRGLPSGVTLLEQFTAFRPHVVILDIGMPVLTGYDVAQSLRASSDGAVVLLIALTGYDTQADRWLSRRSGFDHHLAKPVDPNTLTAIIRDYLAGNRPVN